jgi:ATP-dependent DNA helicase RecQ
VTATRGAARRAAAPRTPLDPAAAGDLDAAILELVATARPAVGRTRAVEVLRGGRSKVVAQHGYDGLPAYGSYAHLRADDVLARVDDLLGEGRIVSTGGRFPKLAPGAG